MATQYTINLLPTNNSSTLSGSFYAFTASGGFSVSQSFDTIQTAYTTPILSYDVTNAVEITYDVAAFNNKMGIIKDAKNQYILSSSYDINTNTFVGFSDSVNLSINELANGTIANQVLSVGGLSTLYSGFMNYVKTYFGYAGGFASLFNGAETFSYNNGIFDASAFVHLLSYVGPDGSGSEVDVSGSFSMSNITSTLRYAVATNCFGNRSGSGSSDPSGNSGYGVADGFLDGDIIFVPGGLTVTLQLGIATAPYSNYTNIGANNVANIIASGTTSSLNYSTSYSGSKSGVSQTIKVPLLIRLTNLNASQVSSLTLNSMNNKLIAIGGFATGVIYDGSTNISNQIYTGTQLSNGINLSQYLIPNTSNTLTVYPLGTNGIPLVAGAQTGTFTTAAILQNAWSTVHLWPIKYTVYATGQTGYFNSAEIINAFTNLTGQIYSPTALAAGIDVTPYLTVANATYTLTVAPINDTSFVSAYGNIISITTLSTLAATYINSNNNLIAMGVYSTAKIFNGSIQIGGNNISYSQLANGNGYPICNILPNLNTTYNLNVYPVNSIGIKTPTGSVVNVTTPAVIFNANANAATNNFITASGIFTNAVIYNVSDNNSPVVVSGGGTVFSYQTLSTIGIDIAASMPIATVGPNETYLLEMYPINVNGIQMTTGTSFNYTTDGIITNFSIDTSDILRVTGIFNTIAVIDNSGINVLTNTTFSTNDISNGICLDSFIKGNYSYVLGIYPINDASHQSQIGGSDVSFVSLANLKSVGALINSTNYVFAMGEFDQALLTNTNDGSLVGNGYYPYSILGTTGLDLSGLFPAINTTYDFTMTPINLAGYQTLESTNFSYTTAGIVTGGSIDVSDILYATGIFNTATLYSGNVQLGNTYYEPNDISNGILLTLITTPNTFYVVTVYPVNDASYQSMPGLGYDLSFTSLAQLTGASILPTNFVFAGGYFTTAAIRLDDDTLVADQYWSYNDLAMTGVDLYSYFAEPNTTYTIHINPVNSAGYESEGFINLTANTKSSFPSFLGGQGGQGGEGDAAQLFDDMTTSAAEPVFMTAAAAPVLVTPVNGNSTVNGNTTIKSSLSYTTRGSITTFSMDTVNYIVYATGIFTSVALYDGSVNINLSGAGKDTSYNATNMSNGINVTSLLAPNKLYTIAILPINMVGYINQLSEGVDVSCVSLAAFSNIAIRTDTTNHLQINGGYDKALITQSDGTLLGSGTGGNGTFPYTTLSSTGLDLSPWYPIPNTSYQLTVNPINFAGRQTVQGNVFSYTTRGDITSFSMDMSFNIYAIGNFSNVAIYDISTNRNTTGSIYNPFEISKGINVSNYMAPNKIYNFAILPINNAGYINQLIEGYDVSCVSLATISNISVLTSTTNNLVVNGAYTSAVITNNANNGATTIVTSAAAYSVLSGIGLDLSAILPLPNNVYNLTINPINLAGRQTVQGNTFTYTSPGLITSAIVDSSFILKVIGSFTSVLIWDLSAGKPLTNGTSQIMSNGLLLSQFTTPNTAYKLIIYPINSAGYQSHVGYTVSCVSPAMVSNISVLNATTNNLVVNGTYTSAIITNNYGIGGGGNVSLVTSVAYSVLSGIGIDLSAILPLPNNVYNLTITAVNSSGATNVQGNTFVYTSPGSIISASIDSGLNLTIAGTFTNAAVYDASSGKSFIGGNLYSAAGSSLPLTSYTIPNASYNLILYPINSTGYKSSSGYNLSFVALSNTPQIVGGSCALTRTSSSLGINFTQGLNINSSKYIAHLFNIIGASGGQTLEVGNVSMTTTASSNNLPLSMLMNNLPGNTNYSVALTGQTVVAPVYNLSAISTTLTGNCSLAFTPGINSFSSNLSYIGTATNSMGNTVITQCLPVSVSPVIVTGLSGNALYNCSVTTMSGINGNVTSSSSVAILTPPQIVAGSVNLTETNNSISINFIQGPNENATQYGCHVYLNNGGSSSTIELGNAFVTTTSSSNNLPINMVVQNLSGNCNYTVKLTGQPVVGPVSNIIGSSLTSGNVTLQFTSAGINTFANNQSYSATAINSVTGASISSSTVSGSPITITGLLGGGNAMYNCNVTSIASSSVYGISGTVTSGNVAVLSAPAIVPGSLVFTKTSSSVGFSFTQGTNTNSTLYSAHILSGITGIELGNVFLTTSAISNNLPLSLVLTNLSGNSNYTVSLTAQTVAAPVVITSGTSLASGSVTLAFTPGINTFASTQSYIGTGIPFASSTGTIATPSVSYISSPVTITGLSGCAFYNCFVTNNVNSLVGVSGSAVSGNISVLTAPQIIPSSVLFTRDGSSAMISFTQGININSARYGAHIYSTTTGNELGNTYVIATSSSNKLPVNLVVTNLSGNTSYTVGLTGQTVVAPVYNLSGTSPITGTIALQFSSGINSFASSQNYIGTAYNTIGNVVTGTCISTSGSLVTITGLTSGAYYNCYVTNTITSNLYGVSGSAISGNVTIRST